MSVVTSSGSYGNYPEIPDNSKMFILSLSQFFMKLEINGVCQDVVGFTEWGEVLWVVGFGDAESL